MGRLGNRATEQALYRQYMDFFEKAERKRRWSIFDDIPWDEWKPEHASEEMAICAETFCAVEMYLPDYTAQGLCLVRESFGQAWFQANWAYEESKHALSLREYLTRSGQRSEDDMWDFEQQILDKKWTMPFTTPRQMVIYGTLQEKATWMLYRAQQRNAKSIGDPVLQAIYRLAGRDEAAHASFYAQTVRLCLDEDRQGALADIAHVISHFRMPAEDLVPDYEKRIKLMRSIGIDQRSFYKEVLFPVLNSIGVTRRELVEARHHSRNGDAGAGRPVEAVE